MVFFEESRAPDGPETVLPEVGLQELDTWWWPSSSSSSSLSGHEARFEGVRLLRFHTQASTQSPPSPHLPPPPVCGYRKGFTYHFCLSKPSSSSSNPSSNSYSTSSSFHFCLSKPSLLEKNAHRVCILNFLTDFVNAKHIWREWFTSSHVVINALLVWVYRICPISPTTPPPPFRYARPGD